jgi:hypothetical protein
MFSDSRTRAENFGISIGRHGRGQSRAPLGCRRSESGARRASAPACAVSNRRDHARTRVVVASNSPRKPRITPATPHRLGRRPSARQRPIECPNADATEPLREMENPSVVRDSAVARPGLEPGTPRFSVVLLNRSSSSDLQAISRGFGIAWPSRTFSDFAVLSRLLGPTGRLVGLFATSRTAHRQPGSWHSRRRR